MSQVASDACQYWLESCAIKWRWIWLDITVAIVMLYFDLRPGPKILFQGNTPEGSDTFQRPVIERDRVGGLRLMSRNIPLGGGR